MPTRPSPPRIPHPTARPRAATWLTVAVATLLAVACTTEPTQTPPSQTTMPEPKPQPDTPGAAPSTTSHARTPRDYRRDAATHLYTQNRHRIFAGKLPPMLYAVGVLQVDINARGAVTGLHWMRAPSHAPEVVAEIERTVRQAAPYPVPARMGKVTYTDTWLWDRSGHFQLDTLTEGQL